MESLRSIKLTAPAKLNLALSVGAPGADGMHPIVSWMVTLDFADEMHLTRLPEESLSAYSIDWHRSAPRRSAIDWSITKDLAVRAHQALEAHVDRSLPLRMRLQKRIPVGGGLGGGSSNAAAMLRGVVDLFDLRISDAELLDIAHGLGSDVPFMLRGGSAVVSGLGEVIERLPEPEPMHFVLACPGFACPTGAVYRAFDAGGPARLRPEAVRAMAQAATLTSDEPFNDLAAAAAQIAPALADDAEELAQLIGLRAHVSGSGSSLFVVCANEVESEAAAAAARTRLQMAALAVRSAPLGPILSDP